MLQAYRGRQLRNLGLHGINLSFGIQDRRHPAAARRHPNAIS
jgi:hypothetical protein